MDTGVVSANFFRILGVAPLYGRTFMMRTIRRMRVRRTDTQLLAKKFGGDPNVVGQKYSMNDKDHVVVGVSPAVRSSPPKWMYVHPHRSLPNAFRETSAA